MQNNKTLEVLNQQCKELSSIYHHVASKYSISDNEFWIWYALLLFDGEKTQQSICELWSFPKQTVNSIISSMVKKGYICLQTMPGTRRKKEICLTKEGIRFGTHIVSGIYAAEQRALNHMSSQEQQMIIHLLTRYIKDLNTEIKTDI